jgi:hypothetical protein
MCLFFLPCVQANGNRAQTLTAQMLIPHLIFYSLCIYFVRISILCFVRRLAGTTRSRTMDRIIVGLHVYHTAFAIAVCLSYLFQCLPVRAGFDLSLRFHPDTVCRDYTTFCAHPSSSDAITC